MTEFDVFPELGAEDRSNESFVMRPRDILTPSRRPADTSPPFAGRDGGEDQDGAASLQRVWLRECTMRHGISPAMLIETLSAQARWLGHHICLAAAIGAWCAGTAVAQSPQVRPTAVGEQEQPREHPLAPAIRVAQTCLEQLQDVRDYECVLTKRERINNQLTQQVMYMRFREEPFSIYCKFGEPFAGREVLYVAGQNNGMMLAHEGSGLKSLVGTVSLAVDSPEARAENRHPLTEAGLRNMLKLLIRQWELESKYGEITVQYYPDARLGEIPCRVIEVLHPQPRRQFVYHITRLYLHAETGLPVRVENYGWPQQAGGQPLLMEEYTYTQLRTNVGFTDQQFDRRCPDYKF